VSCLPCVKGGGKTEGFDGGIVLLAPSWSQRISVCGARNSRTSHSLGEFRPQHSLIARCICRRQRSRMRPQSFSPRRRKLGECAGRILGDIAGVTCYSTRFGQCPDSPLYGKRLSYERGPRVTATFQVASIFTKQPERMYLCVHPLQFYPYQHPPYGRCFFTYFFGWGSAWRRMKCCGMPFL